MIDAPFGPPVKRNHARSLLKSVVTTPPSLDSTFSAISEETSVKVLFPLLRHKTFLFGPMRRALGRQDLALRMFLPDWLQTRSACDVQVEVAVVVVIYKGYSAAAFFDTDTDGFGYLREPSGAVVVEQMDAAAQANGKIGFAVVVVVTRGATESAAGYCQARAGRFVFELSVTRIMQKMERAFFPWR